MASKKKKNKKKKKKRRRRRRRRGGGEEEEEEEEEEEDEEEEEEEEEEKKRRSLDVCGGLLTLTFGTAQHVPLGTGCTLRRRGCARLTINYILTDSWKVISKHEFVEFHRIISIMSTEIIWH